MNYQMVDDTLTAKRIPVRKIDWIEEAYAHVTNCETGGETAIASALIAIAVELRRLNDSRDVEEERAEYQAELREKRANFWAGKSYE